MSRELIKYPKITKYSSIWMDTVRNGEFGLTNTNRLVRFYKGCTGLKTGSTSKAGFCISATAERNGMSLIAVIMGSPSRDERNAAAVSLLNYGFSNFTVFSNDQKADITIPVVKGKVSGCQIRENEFKTVINKKSLSKVERSETYESCLVAPVKKGQSVGTVTYSVEGKVIGQVNIVTVQEVDALNFWDVFVRIIAKFSYC
jgi:D-alanyl-D-alanine carboxypeptidase (penicillin-binding protein 5/6)